MVWKTQRPELTVTHLLAGQPSVVLYRIVRRRSPEEADFTSAFVLGHPPPRRVQQQSAPIWMALSMLSGLDAARSRARLFPVLGGHVARVELNAGEGFALAETIERGHFSVWGDPLKLRTAVTDVYPAE
jgi:hypothetical protein